MILGIDASNIRNGGGVTHLTEVLNAAQPQKYGFSKIIVWGNHSTLHKIQEQPWLTKQAEAFLEGNLIQRAFWQKFELDRLVEKYQCELLYVPGGTYSGRLQNVVSMSQNLLPFERSEATRYGVSLKALKFSLLRWTQSNTFRTSKGVIFLSKYAKNIVLNHIEDFNGQSEIIPHGISQIFYCPPRSQYNINTYTFQNPFKIIYISRIDAYKHQWSVAQAVGTLRERGYPIQLQLIGSNSDKNSIKKLNRIIKKYDPKASFIKVVGSIPYDRLPDFYHNSDIGVFASSCENLPNILLENMASGLPIACSRKGPMPEILKENGVYFDPERPQEIADALEQLIVSPGLRQKMALEAFHESQVYSWEKCADDTFSFLAHCRK